ncbi:MAG: exodeoxyribonuclease VII large subunit [Mogibacterium diversum]|jgi:exodeoxyribonuclease VII, large subunit|uniref:exodeoxyribonuclease VII large subunit n=1 Tax=Mogibacterium diversum TaxID=114527 RepID=UPI001CB089AA|nr:exodeoxyribonuclease VII large subunit [Mogibacterium diversum]MBF1170539.1 exodeoxyribonuclease VII large subunit [[Eubacterium] sulci]MBF1328729.1 exodeoxyribonuclease VII large subunit [Mogibacterium diversum]MBF1337738.1 exodeoxyribonuclease VII large subunit [Mogibacterium diversum]MBF1340625.1 exodeoxyribonuclease VII large subunit [Mogibacterium diversum]MBF1355534.1 exodeoxyribonuclease VII large subunit [Mogibacterium diversum]
MNPFSITQFNEYVSKKLNGDPNLKNLPLIGEVSGVSTSGGHMYFSLKDENSVLRAVIWRSNISRIDTSLIKNGSKIVALGDISAYARGGNYSFSIRMVESFGEGDLAKEYNRVKKLLESEGLFSREHKKPIPRFVKHIGVITSDTGAAIEDIKKIITSKNDYADIIIFPTLVQGIGSPASIIKSIETANNYSKSVKRIDVLIIGRGGGSAEDLAAFNDEGVARAIFASKIPTISAVGHESDVSISDWVADARAETPTAAADMAAINTFELREQIARNEQELKKSIAYKIKMERNNIKIQREHLIHAMSGKIREMKLNIDKAVITLKENNPTNVLSKGYALVTKNDKVVSGMSNIALDEIYTITMADGSFEAKTTSKTQN